MSGSLPGHGQGPPSAADNSARRWGRDIGIAAGVGLVYFLLARLSQGLLREPYRVAVFCWPPAGLTSGAMIALGPRARWSVAAGVIVANTLANLTTNVSVPETFVFALGNTVEPLVVSELIQRCFGSSFTSATRLKAPPRGNMIAGPADKTESLNDLGAVIS